MTNPLSVNSEGSHFNEFSLSLLILYSFLSIQYYSNLQISVIPYRINLSLFEKRNDEWILHCRNKIIVPSINYQQSLLCFWLLSIITILHSITLHSLIIISSLHSVLNSNLTLIISSLIGSMKGELSVMLFDTVMILRILIVFSVISNILKIFPSYGLINDSSLSLNHFCIIDLTELSIRS